MKTTDFVCYLRRCVIYQHFLVPNFVSIYQDAIVKLHQKTNYLEGVKWKSIERG